MINEKWGYINELGEIIIPAQFDWAESFSEGLAFVKLDDEGYFIDTSGRIVSKPTDNRFLKQRPYLLR